MTSTTIAELLAGCELGPVQSVGRMQVVPLLADPAPAADEFVAPPACRTATTAYGTLVFDNPHEQPLLVPCHAGFVVCQAAQDHAMAHAALVAGKSSAAFDTALCVQETQGGTIAAGEHAMVILPFPLREPALAVRDRRGYNRLWPAVRAFNAGVGLQAVANLAVFFGHFAQELDRFVAEFESLDGQVGAVVLADGGVLGVERTPSVAYWETLWAPLLRGCYGAEMIRRQQIGAPARPPATRVPLDTTRAGSLEEVAGALDAADRAERRLTHDRIAEVERLLLKADDAGGRQVDRARLETVHGWRFVGQVLRRGGRVVYASLVARGG
jgi:hypothetical protein